MSKEFQKVYVRANQLRYFIGVGLAIVFLPVILVAMASGDYLLAFVGIPVLSVDLAFLWFAGETEYEFLRSDRLDIFVDEGFICGPVKDGLFELARPEAVSFDAIDLTRSQYSILLGSYLALKDGRRMIVSSFAHSAENVRRVFEEVRRRVEK